MCDIISSDPVWDVYRKRIEADLAFWKSDLAPLEFGDIHVGERLADGPWVDVTDAMIASHKRSITMLETVLAVC